MPDRPWSRSNRGNPITETWLARRLAKFGIQSKNIRLHERRAKGYELRAFFGEKS